MEIHKIDSIIKDALNDSENFYDSDATDAKQRIWNKVQPKKKSRPIFLLLLAAASILLLLGISMVTFNNMRYKSTINTLVDLNNQFKNELLINKQNSLTEKKTIADSYKHTTDTIYLEKKVVEYKTLVTTKHITDTVYVEQIVYVEKEPDSNLILANGNASMSESPIKPNNNSYKSEILISNNEEVKNEKRKKIQIKFGGNRNQVRNGTLAVTTKL